VSSSPRIRVLTLALALALVLPIGGAATPRHGGGAKPKPARTGAIAKKRKPRRHVRKVRLTLGDRAALLAQHEVGTPYVWGGGGPGGFDCSGLTSWVYGKLGVPLPHNAAAQFGVGRAIGRSELRRGDLLFFHGLGHVGLYLGGGRMVHAPQSGRGVEVVRLADHYAASLVGARRIARA
jgi:cell wall-associated NlpC family hydrolase